MAKQKQHRGRALSMYSAFVIDEQDVQNLVVPCGHYGVNDPAFAPAFNANTTLYSAAARWMVEAGVDPMFCKREDAIDLYAGAPWKSGHYEAWLRSPYGQQLAKKQCGCMSCECPPFEAAIHTTNRRRRQKQKRRTKRKHSQLVGVSSFGQRQGVVAALVPL